MQLAVALVWFVMTWLALAWLTWLRPVFDWDGLYYHVPAIHGWDGPVVKVTVSNG